jgi:iron-sulfur cluster repair protein YtfE (RIC family)
MIKSASQVGRLLHQEHLDTLAAMNTLEEIIDSRFRDRPLDVSSDAVRQQLSTLITAIDHDLYVHFQFEERDVFPILDRAGLGDMTAMLIHEHDAIRRLADRLRSVAVGALQNTFDKTTWREFREAGMDLVPSVMFHIQKEEMGVIRRLDVFLDAATDKTLADRHAEGAS